MSNRGMRGLRSATINYQLSTINRQLSIINYQLIHQSGVCVDCEAQFIIYNSFVFLLICSFCLKTSVSVSR
jgi:hypothetical protein